MDPTAPLTTGHFALIDGVVLAIYFVATFAIGIAFWRRSRSVEGFTAAERNLPGWLLGVSIVGTFVSSISFLALPGKAFATDWNPFVFSLSLPVATWISVKWFVPFYRRSGYISAYSHLEQRFGPWARGYASICYLLTQLARVGTVTYLMALPMAVLLGWDIRWIIIGTGVATTAYTFVGGIVAVVWTDLIQTIVLVVGAITCAVLLVVGLPGGPSQLFQIASEHHKFSLGDFGVDLTHSTFWVVLAYGLVMNLQNFGVDQNYVQRYHAAKSDREAEKSLWLGGLVYIPISAMFYFIGTALFAYYYAKPGLLPVEYQVPSRSDSVFPFFIVTALPRGVVGLLIASIFAAAMSTISSSLNSSATIVLRDFYERYFRPAATERQKMIVLYAGTCAVGLLGTGAALAMIHVKSALDAWWNLAGIFGGGMLGLFLLGLISPRVSGRAALTGVAFGIALILWMAVSSDWAGALASWRSPFHSFLTIVFGTAALLLVGLAVTAISTRSLGGGRTAPMRQ